MNRSQNVETRRSSRWSVVQSDATNRRLETRCFTHLLRKSLVSWCWLAALLCCAMVVDVVSAQSAPQRAIDTKAVSLLDRIQRVDIPADFPNAWPDAVKRTTAIERSEFERLLSATQKKDQGPSGASLLAARYTATLAGTTFHEGHAVFSIHRVTRSPSLLSLGRVGIPIRDLMWKERPAVWGSDREGTVWLLADNDVEELTGNWSAAGRTLSNGIDFDLTLPDAMSTTVDLKIPRDRIVRSVPEALPVEEGSNASWQVWRIQLGGEHRVRLQVMPRDSVSIPRKSVVVYETEMSALVRSEDFRFQTQLQLEVFDAPINEVTLSIPASVEVYAVTYGVDTPLAWTRSNEADAIGSVTIKLPGPLKGRGRPIRIDGLVAQKSPGQPTIAPQIAVQGGVFASGRQILTIVAPLQLRSIRSRGFRQLTATTSTPDGETVIFKQLMPDSQLILDVRQPRAALSAQVTALLEVQADSWTLSSEIVWSSSSGDVYQTACQFPADWEITDVQLISTASSSGSTAATSSAAGATASSTQRLAGWDVHTQPGMGTQVSMEFLEAIDPARPHAVRIFARRRPPAAGQSFALPVPNPSNCVAIETMLGLIVPNGLTPHLSDEVKLERVSVVDDAAIHSLRRSTSLRGRTEFWYRGDTLDGSGTLQLVPRLRPINASIDVTVEAAPAEYRERFEIRSRNEGRPLDRLLIYLTQAGPEVRWSMLLPRPGELTSIRLPMSQHSDWNLPSSGELWELRLPPLPDGPIELVGTRSSRWAGVARPSLLFIPQAIESRGKVRLRRPVSLELLVEQSGLDAPLPAAEGTVSGEGGNGEAVPFTTTVWQFDSFADELTVGLKRPEPSKEFPTMVSLQLSSLISTNADGFDLYRARIRLENGTVQDQLRIRLPSPAVLQEVTVAGEATVPETTGELIVIQGVNAARHDLVELLYRVPESGRPIRDARRIIVPQIDSTVLNFDWEFALPPTVKIFAEPSGVRLTRLLPQSTWTQRLFGPLGRSRGEALFNPTDLEHWRHLFDPPETTLSSVGEVSGELIAPVEWQVHRASSPVIPNDLWLVTWHTTRTRLLSWMVLTISLAVGISVRIIGWRYRARLATYWLTLLIAVAACAPSPIDEIAGGAIAGTIISLLIPRRVFRIQGANRLVVPMGSTQNFPVPASVGTLLGMILFAAAVVAQDSVTSNEALTVYVPVDAKGKPSDKVPLVYVAPELLERLKEMASRVKPNRLDDLSQKDVSSQGARSFQERLPLAVLSTGEPINLLSEMATYRANVSAQGTVSLRALFRVHVLDSSVEQSFVVPIADAVPTGTDACRVNGKTHPILNATDGRGFVITLPAIPGRTLSQANVKSVPPTDQLTSTPVSPNESDDRSVVPADATHPDNQSQTIRGNETSTIATYEVELDLKRVGNRTSQGGGFVMSVPSVLDSRWTVSLPEPADHLELLDASGASVRTEDKKGIECQFGAGQRVDVRWSQNALETIPTRCEVSMLHACDIKPDFAEVRFRLRMEPLDGAVDAFAIDLPVGALVRESEIQCENLLSVDIVSVAPVAPMMTGSDRLRITFSEPQRDPVTINGRFLLPVKTSGTGMPLPRVSPARTADVRVSTIRNWCWITSPPEFRLETRNVEGDLTASVGADEFIREWGDDPPTGRPQLVFQPREGSAPLFELAPQSPRRRALSWVQSGRVGKRRLEWTLSARIETSQAPAFQHVLLVDRRLQIESISVRENGAERMLRWSESRQTSSPNRVTIFLTDKTQGIQQITVKGSLSIRFGPAFPLPFVRCEEAELAEARWELFRDSEVDVDLTLPRGVPAYSPNESASPDASSNVVSPTGPTANGNTSDEVPVSESSSVLIARYTVADPDPRSSIRVYSQHSSCTVRSIGLLAKTDERGWKLNGQMWLTPQGPSPRRMGIRFPEKVDPERVRVERAEASWHDPEEGFRRLDLTLPPDPIEVSVTFDVVVEEPLRGDWELPWPVPLQATQHETLLLTMPPDIWTPLIGTELKPDEASGWADEFLEERMPETQTAMYRLSSLPVRLRRTTSTSHLDQPVVRLLEHSLWLSESRDLHGVTRAYLSQTRDVIDFEIPADFRPVALFLDDHPLPLPASVGSNWRIPLTGGGRESILVLVWKAQASPEDGAVEAMSSGTSFTFKDRIPAVIRQSLPWPSRIDVARTLATVLPHRLGFLVGSSEQTSRDWLDAAFDRLEMFLDRQQSLGNDPRAAASNRSLIDEMQSRVASRLPAHTRRISKALSARLERWDRIVFAINELDPPDPFNSQVAVVRSLALLDELFVDHPQALRTLADTEHRQIGFWVFDRIATAFVAGLILVTISIPVLRRMIRLDWGEWLGARSSISWMLLGFVWWLLMTPGFLGPIMIVSSIVRMTWMRIPAATAARGEDS